MLLRLLVVCGLVWGMSQVAFADDPVTSAVVNSPTTGWDLTKDVVNYLEPGADVIYTFNEGGPIQGFSGALYTFHSKGWPLASIRAGYGLTDPVTYGTFALDLPGLAGRFIPSAVKNVSPGTLNGALAFASKYIRVGPAVGYDWDDTRPRWGVSVGAAASF